MGGVIVCKKYAIIVSLIDCNTQQLMEDLALEVQRESSTNKIIAVTSAVALDGVSLLASIVAAHLPTSSDLSHPPGPGNYKSHLFLVILLHKVNRRIFLALGRHSCYLAICKQIQQDIMFLKILLLAPPTQPTSFWYRDAASHQVRPTQPQDKLNKGKSIQSFAHFSKSKPALSIMFLYGLFIVALFCQPRCQTQFLRNLDKGKQVCSLFTIFETGCMLDVSTQHYAALNTVPIKRFREQGHMYHFIDDLVASNEKPNNLQLYFSDHENELASRMAKKPQTIRGKANDKKGLKKSCHFKPSTELNFTLESHSNFSSSFNCLPGPPQFFLDSFEF
ncbi:hypothetical protein KY289_035827 [Solanum tuberosum]|nr:hypothetical protein KY289_035827 [Solanum tuberosum]